MVIGAGLTGLILLGICFVGITPYLFYGLVIEPMQQERRHPGIHRKYDKAIGFYYEAENAKRRGDRKTMTEKQFQAAVIYSDIDLYAAKNMFDKMDFELLNSESRTIALELRKEVEIKLKIPNWSIKGFSQESDYGYCNVEESLGNSYRRSGNYKEAAEHYKKAFESFCYSRMTMGFSLIDTFEALKQYKDAIFVADEIISQGIVSQKGIENLTARKNVLQKLDQENSSMAIYQEEYQKFKNYKNQYLKAKSISAKENPELAEKELRKAIEIAPREVDEVRVHTYLLYVFDVSGQYDRALEEVEWLKQNMAKLNDRLVDGLDSYIWLINQHKLNKLKPIDQ